MAKIGILLTILVVLMLFIGCVGVARSTSSKPLAESSLVYKFIENGEKVVFTFDEKSQGKSSVSSVNIAGTFNQWNSSSVDWKMEKTGKRVWELTVPADKACIPGNSGYAEFKFVVNGNVWVDPLPTTPAGYTFKKNNLIVFAEEGEDIDEIVAEIIEAEKIAKTAKRAGDFNPENEDDRKTIANFRLVPGTKLFRSYNPCRASRDYDGEVNRLAYVNEFLESNGIKSIISVSGVYENPPKYIVSEYVQAIVDGGNFFHSEPSYESVYFESDSADFGNLIKGIVEFIIDFNHEAPFLVHCKIGTDRTGVVSAMLAALCGTTWENICVDYQKSNEAGIEEYRSRKLLQYSFENMLKMKLVDAGDLKAAVANYFIDNGYLSSLQIAALEQKLKQ